VSIIEFNSVIVGLFAH
jgi:hypothetical protein